MILTRLREETRSAHERLEIHIDLLERPWSMSFYQRLLEKFYGFYDVVEPATFQHSQWQQVGIEPHQRLKTPLLVRDLQFLGLSSGAIGNLPRCERAPVAPTFAEALGCAYVLEGSTLGGQIITRHLRRELGLEAERGSAFFVSYGSEVGPMWRQFVEVLNTYPLTETQQNDLVQSACDTFRTFDDWLCEIL
jgi:heme oxygenase